MIDPTYTRGARIALSALLKRGATADRGIPPLRLERALDLADAPSSALTARA